MKMNKKGRRTGITMNKKLGSTLIAMTIIIFMLFLTLGMFTKNFGGSASAEIASAQTSIKEIHLDNESVNEGEPGTYVFAVSNTNKNDGNVSEVSVQYGLTVTTKQTDANNPITVNYQLSPAVYNQSDNTYTADESKSVEKVSTDSNDVEFNATDSVPMRLMINNKKEAQVDYYILKFTPNKSGEFQFKVKFTSQQID